MTRRYADPAYQTNRLVCLERDRWRCHWCGGQATTADHYPLPLSAGGNHHLDNLVASCRRCNSRGGAAIANDVRRGRSIGRTSRHW